MQAAAKWQAPGPPDAHTFRIFISTDNHLGFDEKNEYPPRRDDSFRAVEEVLENATAAQASPARAECAVPAPAPVHMRTRARACVHACACAHTRGAAEPGGAACGCHETVAVRACCVLSQGGGGWWLRGGAGGHPAHGWRPVPRQ